MNLEDMKSVDVEGMIYPPCGIGTLLPPVVAETLRVGANAVEVSVAANVCGYCGEHWFDPPAQAVIDTAIRQVRDGNVAPSGAS